MTAQSLPPPKQSSFGSVYGKLASVPAKSPPCRTCTQQRLGIHGIRQLHPPGACCQGVKACCRESTATLDKRLTSGKGERREEGKRRRRGGKRDKRCYQRRCTRAPVQGLVTMLPAWEEKPQWDARHPRTTLFPLSVIWLVGFKQI